MGYGGRDHIRIARSLKGVEVTAVADANAINLAPAQRIVEQSQGKSPRAYSVGPQDYRNLVLQSDLDSVITAGTLGIAYVRVGGCHEGRQVCRRGSSGGYHAGRVLGVGRGLRDDRHALHIESA